MGKQGMPGELSRRRYRVLKRARALARSGQYPDYLSIANAVQDLQGFDEARDWFDDPRFLAQLRKLCAMARDRGTRVGLVDDPAPVRSHEGQAHA